MRAILACLSLVCALSTACNTARVEVVRVRGVYSTHFDGIPDQGRVCAVIENQRETPVDWVRLRLGSRNERGGRWRSVWLYRGRLKPGASVAVELQRPPVANEIRLRVHQAGRGRVRGTGRPAQEVSECSERALLAAIEREDGPREARDRDFVPMRNLGSAAGEPRE